MTKFFFLVVFSLMVGTTFAQDIKEIKNLTLLGQTQKAREAVDKFLAVPKNAQKAEGWYYKGYNYNMASKDSTKSLAESAELKATAFEALKQFRNTFPDYCFGFFAYDLKNETEQLESKNSDGIGWPELVFFVP